MRELWDIYQPEGTTDAGHASGKLAGSCIKREKTGLLCDLFWGKKKKKSRNSHSGFFFFGGFSIFSMLPCMHDDVLEPSRRQCEMFSLFFRYSMDQVVYRWLSFVRLDQRRNSQGKQTKNTRFLQKERSTHPVTSRPP